VPKWQKRAGEGDADQSCASNWELKPGVPVLSKILPTLSKLQHTEIVVGGYTDNAPIGAPLQSAGISNNLDLSCKRAASVVG
jgi:flagellar motor protein MotB